MANNAADTLRSSRYFEHAYALAPAQTQRGMGFFFFISNLERISSDTMSELLASNSKTNWWWEIAQTTTQ